jgi:fatty acid desaturase
MYYSTASIWTYTLNVSYAYICIGSQSTLFPTFAIKVFGSKVGAKIFPMIYFFFAMANVLQWALTYFFFPQMSDYKLLIWILGGLVVLSFFLTCFIQEDPDWYKAVKQFNESNQPNKELSSNKPSEELLKGGGKKA